MGAFVDQGPRCCLSMLYTDICPIFFGLIEFANRHIGWLVGWSANWHIGGGVSGGAMLKLAGVHTTPYPLPTPTPLSKIFLEAMLSTALLMGLCSKIKIVSFFIFKFYFPVFLWARLCYLSVPFWTSSQSNLKTQIDHHLVKSKT